MYLLILMFYFFDSSISIEHFVAFSSIVLVLEVVSFIRDLGFEEYGSPKVYKLEDLTLEGNY